MDGSGFAVWVALREHSPQTRSIAYSTLSDRGRSLYAVATRQWFGSFAIVDKSADGPMLQALARGANVMPPGWQDRLREASRINGLFARPSWLDIWRTYEAAKGSAAAFRGLAPHLKSSMIRQFTEEAVDHVSAVRRLLLGEQEVEDGGRQNIARNGPLVSFASTNSLFFNAPELQTVLDRVRPWDGYQ